MSSYRAVVLVILVVFCSCFTTTYGYSNGDGDGDGVEGNPLEISTVADWQELMVTPGDWDKHFILTADLDLAGVNLTPVGNISTAFTGVFDGNGRVIHNAVISLPSTDNVGLFGYLDTGGEIRNLGVEDGDITGGRSCVGGLVGRNYGGTITDCYATFFAVGGGSNSCLIRSKIPFNCPRDTATSAI